MNRTKKLIMSFVAAAVLGLGAPRAGPGHTRPR